jgi:hypothetical protein
MSVRLSFRKHPNTVKPQFTNASDHEHFSLWTIYPNTKRLRRPHKPSTSWSDKQGVSASAVFVEEWSSGKYLQLATPIGESFSCFVAFVHANVPCQETEKRIRIPFQTITFPSSPPSTYAVNSPSYRHGKTKLSFRLYLICLVLCFPV